MDTVLFNKVFLGNTLGSWLVSLIIFAAGLLAVLLLRIVIRKRMKKAAAPVFAWIDRVVPLASVAAGYVALMRLELNETWSRVLSGTLTLIAAVVIVKGVNHLAAGAVGRWAQRHAAEHDGENAEETVRRYRPLLTLLQLVVWLLGALFFLGNLGIDVSAVIAGLGVSGIAVAIAAQGILGDLFNYFVILFDRPFEVGDFIIFGDKMGGVEKIGIKTTRIRAIGGEQLIIANSALTGSKIHNYKRMERRRVVFQVGVTYQTSRELLEEIPRRIRAIIEEIGEAVFDRSHFKNFGDFSLNFETVYYVSSADYVLYMDIQQKINLRIAEEFENMGVEFAYPTQLVYVAGGEETRKG